MYSINCKGKLLLFDSPKVMGIVNLTPDSFFKGFLGESEQALVDLAGGMLEQGAHILDIGGQSTRPGSTLLSASVEAERVLPAIAILTKHFPGAIFSVDTFYASVAIAAVHNGAVIVNDISGGNMDAAMIEEVGRLKVPYVCTHIKGTPQNMQQNPVYENVAIEVLDYFSNKLAACRAAGILDVIADPGFGFGKTLAHNYTLLKELNVFKMLGVPVLAGVSRKGMIQKVIGKTAAQSLNGTTAVHTIALLNGANLLRVHDVAEAVEAVEIVRYYQHTA